MMAPIMELQAIETQTINRIHPLFSIGHSNHTWDAFVELLHRAEVTAIVDVRSTPYSQRQPHFSRPELEVRLPALDIMYRYLGTHLGGRPRDSSVYDADGRVDYERVRESDHFRAGIRVVLQILEKHAAAMLCAEEDPLHCHRGLMITPALKNLGLTPVHLRGNGARETTEEMEQRLLDETGVGAGILDGLFAALISADERAERVADAYRALAKKKAFRQSHQQVETE